MPLRLSPPAAVRRFLSFSMVAAAHYFPVTVSRCWQGGVCLGAVFSSCRQARPAFDRLHAPAPPACVLASAPAGGVGGQA